MRIRTVLAATLLATSCALPAYAQEAVGVYAEFGGTVCSSSEDPLAAGGQDAGIGAEMVSACCYFYGQLSATSGRMDFEFGCQVWASSTSESQPELAAVGATLVSRAQGVAGERPTLTYSVGPIGCAGAVCTIGGGVRDWPIRPVEVCVFGYATFGPLPLVTKNVPERCRTKAGVL